MRILRGIAALVALVFLLVGIPFFLATFGGNPLPNGLSWEAAGQALLRPASDRVLIGIVALAGWLVWAAFAASVVAEIANALPGRRIQLRLPGLGLGQKFAAVLIIAVVAMIATPHGAPTAIAEPRSPAPTPTTTVSAPQTPVTPPATLATPAHDTSHASPAETTKTTKPPQKRQHVHVVERGDYLWNLADRYLGDGSRWQEIAAANPGINPDRIDVGQRLVIPVNRHAADQPAGEKRVAAHDGDTVRVERGDSLAAISDDLYGSTKHWPDLYEENKDQISDPDLIEVGQNLQLPDRRVLADTDHTVHHAPREAADTEREVDEPAAQDTKDPDAGSAAPSRQAPDREQAPDRDPAQTQQQQPAPASSPSATRTAQPAETVHPAHPGTVTQSGDEVEQNSDHRAPVAAVSVGLLLAAGLITTLNSRRRRQLHARQPGRQVPSPGPEATEFEHEIEAQHQPLRFEHLDLVTKAIAARCRQTGEDLPALTAVRIADERIDLLFSRPAAGSPPPGVDVGADGSVWTVHSTDLAAVRAVDGIDTAIPPYPALITLGLDPDTAHVLVNLEAAAALTIAADNADNGARMMATVALELALSPWSADLDLTFVGPMLPGFTEGLDHPAVTHTNDADRVLAGLERRAAARRRHLTDDATIGQKRLDPDLADAWCPHVVLFGHELNPEQARRLAGVVTDLPRVAIAAVTTSESLTGWRYDLSAGGTGRLAPFGWHLTPQMVSDMQYLQLLELVTASGTDETTPAPWWDHDTPDDSDRSTDLTAVPSAPDPVRGQLAVSQPGNSLDARDRDGAADVSTVADGAEPRPRPRAPLTLHALVTAAPSTTADAAAPKRVSEGPGLEVDDEGDGEAWMALTSPPPVDRPMLRLIGAPELVGARGPANRRYKQRSLEILFYLLEHPGATMPTLTSTFSLSRDYAKSLISNLRRTLGADDGGDLYLPEMGQGPGYRLHDQVTCDLYYVNQLIGRGVNTAPDEILLRILAVVRGEPFLGADDWRLGFNLQAIRTDISSKLTDAAHELTTRALAAGNIPLARWATSQGRTADPLNQALMADEVRTEAQAGNKAVVARLADRMSATARELGSDLTDDAKEALRDAIAM